MSDPDDRGKTPKARLVLVGWQDPELGRIATDSPTLRKESKSLVCAAMRKTAFVSGDPSDREIYFQPPPEILAWVSNDQAFLSSYLQSMQDKGLVSHVQLYSKALKEI